MNRVSFLLVVTIALILSNCVNAHEFPSKYVGVTTGWNRSTQPEYGVDEIHYRNSSLQNQLVVGWQSLEDRVFEISLSSSSSFHNVDFGVSGHLPLQEGGSTYLSIFTKGGIIGRHVAAGLGIEKRILFLESEDDFDYPYNRNIAPALSMYAHLAYIDQGRQISINDKKVYLSGPSLEIGVRLDLIHWIN